MRISPTWIAVATGLIVGTTAASWMSRPARGAPPHLYLMPIGDSGSLLDDLASQVKLRFHLAVTVLPQRSPDRAAYNDFRRQFEADKLLESVRQAQPTLANDPDVRLIAITPYDLYWNGKPEWRFTFGVREENRLAIISYARMDPVNLGDPPNDEVLRSRLRKMLTKDIGLMCLGLAMNDNPRSALYGNVLGVDELDVMTEEFDPKQ
jgi:predicted Zn-dependent protease